MTDLSESSGMSVQRPGTASDRRVRTRRPRVLCITPLGLDGRGGIDRLYRYLREQPEGGDVDVRYLVSRGAKPGLLWVAVFPWHLARITYTLASWRPDLVHINYANGGSLVRKFAIVSIAKLLRRRLLTHLHDIHPIAGFESGRLASAMAGAICRMSDHTIAIGRRAQRAFVELAGIPASRVHVIANGVPDIGAGVVLPKRNARVELLFAGEIGPRKGATILVEALAQLRDRSDWACTIAGNGDVAGCRALIKELALEGRVELMDWAPSGVVHNLMRRADAVVLPSAREVMPMALIEGAAAGAALLATPVGEIGDVLEDGSNGIVIERDPVKLAAAIASLLDDPAKLARMQLASRKAYEANFRIDVFKQRLGAVYGLALGSR